MPCTDAQREDVGIREKGASGKHSLISRRAKALLYISGEFNCASSLVVETKL